MKKRYLLANAMGNKKNPSVHMLDIVKENNEQPYVDANDFPEKEDKSYVIRD